MTDSEYIREHPCLACLWDPDWIPTIGVRTFGPKHQGAITDPKEALARLKKEQAEEALGPYLNRR